MRMSCLAVVTAFCLQVASFGQVEIDSNLPDYEPGAPVAGSIKSVGTDTMNNMMTLWSEGF